MRPRLVYRIFSALLTLTALGIAAFWASWFGSGQAQNALPICYRIFENAFPWPDGVMALLMLAAAVGLWRCAPWGLCAALASAGMCAQLALLDTYYHATHGNFVTSSPEFAGRVLICAHTTLFSLALIVYLWLNDAALQTRVAITDELIRKLIPRTRTEVRNAAMPIALYGAGLAVFTLLRSLQPPPDEIPCAREFFDAFLAADLFAAAVSLAAAALLWLNPVRGYRAFWIAAGLALFRAIIHIAFHAQNPLLVGDSAPLFIAGHAGIIAFTLVAGVLLWRRRTALGA